MSPTRTLCMLSIAGLAAVAAASDEPLKLGDLTMTYATPVSTKAPGETGITYEQPQVGAAAAAVTAIFSRPTVGIRIGGGTWNTFSLNAGADITYKVPFLPLPAIRLDGQVWGRSTSFGSGDHGNSLALLGLGSFVVGYAGIGPAYYFTYDAGVKHSGWGADLLAGMNIPGGHGLFVEIGAIVGPGPAPVFVDLGMRF